MVEYRYQATGELAEVKDWNGRLTRYRYDASGKLIETRRPNGSQEQRAYDAAGQLIRLTDTSGQGIRLQQFKYDYSPGGLLLKEENKQYTYDTLKRLRSGAEPGRIVHYTYDPSGNLTSEQVGTSPMENPGNLPIQKQLHYTWDNRLQRVGDYPVEMDANGNLLYATDGSTASAYEYDARNRLVKAGKLKYRYNPQGDRIELAQCGQVTRYVIDDAPELSRVLMELDGEGNVKARYVYGLGLIGREDADGTYLSYHYDLRGSTTLMTDEQNRVTDRYTYRLYGELEQHEGVTVQPFAYNGRDGVMTDANRLYYMRARYYDPKLKRFLNRDVIRGDIQDGQTFNRYAYVNGNPVSYIDPLGLMKCETGGAGKNDGFDVKNDDFAKEPFLPEQYYQKMDNYLDKAIAARDAEVARIQALSKTQQSKFTTVVAGVDLRTGEVIVGSKNSTLYKGQAICAEDLVIGKFIPPSNANIIMTSAIRPRTGEVIAVCTRCQTKFPVNQFIKGTVFD
ncbi:RHS repeat domain-containing protein [Paenibacillus amylolyticus]|uniref:RHS repeat domain-containing protein n=1 Tax=Paenibacillus amylolyticus TaxID=1451 RepID=UPI003392067E